MTDWEYFVAPLLEHNPGEILDTFGAGRVGAGERGGRNRPRSGADVDGGVPEASQGLGERRVRGSRQSFTRSVPADGDGG